jgi:hypothetical protein
VKIRHDLHPNISLGIGDNPDYGSNAFLITEIHNFFNMGHTSYVHRFQLCEIRQESKTRLHFHKRGSDFFGASLHRRADNAATVTDYKQIFRLIDSDCKSRWPNSRHRVDWDPTSAVITGSKVSSCENTRLDLLP